MRWWMNRFPHFHPSLFFFFIHTRSPFFLSSHLLVNNGEWTAASQSHPSTRPFALHSITPQQREQFWLIYIDCWGPFPIHGAPDDKRRAETLVGGGGPRKGGVGKKKISNQLIHQSSTCQDWNPGERSSVSLLIFLPSLILTNICPYHSTFSHNTHNPAAAEDPLEHAWMPPPPQLHLIDWHDGYTIKYNTPEPQWHQPQDRELWANLRPRPLPLLHIHLVRGVYLSLVPVPFPEEGGASSIQGIGMEGILKHKLVRPEPMEEL